jgi:phage terminase small subunit
MATQTTALKAKQRCPGCLSHAERGEGGICINCEQYEVLLKLVVALSEACEIVKKAYSIKPHPAVASLQAEIVAASKNVNKAVGIE